MSDLSEEEIKFIRELEELCLKLHSVNPNSEQDMGSDTLITGVNLVLVFDIVALDSERGIKTMSYSFQGKQSGSTTIGLGERARAYTRSEHLYEDDE